MSHFIRTSFGLINLDRVSHITFSPGGKYGGDKATFWDGETRIGSDDSRSYDRWETGDAWMGTIVPAAPGQIAVVVSSYAPGDQKPTEDDIWLTDTQVVAWRIGETYVEPIFIEDLGSNETALIPTPDGGLIEIGSTVYPSRHAAKAAYLAQALDNWLHKHPEP